MKVSVYISHTFVISFLQKIYAENVVSILFSIVSCVTQLAQPGVHNTNIIGSIPREQCTYTDQNLKYIHSNVPAKSVNEKKGPAHI